MPRRGWRRGLFLSCVYAPTSAAGKAARQAVRHEVDTVMGLAEATSMRMVVGDFNAEMGNNHGHSQHNNEVVGSFARPKRLQRARNGGNGVGDMVSETRRVGIRASLDLATSEISITT